MPILCKVKVVVGNPGHVDELNSEHHMTLDLTEWMGLESDTTLYLSVTLSDGESTVTSPGPASPAYMSTLFSLIFP